MSAQNHLSPSGSSPHWVVAEGWETFPKSLVKLVRLLLGYCFSPITERGAMFIFWGPTTCMFFTVWADKRGQRWKEQPHRSWYFNQ